MFTTFGSHWHFVQQTAIARFVAPLCCDSRQPHHQCPGLGMRSIESDHQGRSRLRVANSCCPQYRVREEHVRAARLIWTSKTKALGAVEKFDTREQCGHVSRRAGRRRRRRTRCRAWSWLQRGRVLRGSATAGRSSGVGKAAAVAPLAAARGEVSADGH